LVKRFYHYPRDPIKLKGGKGSALSNIV
jgi:hypothetical protein